MGTIDKTREPSGQLNPGDDAPGTAQSGEDVCLSCGGSGRQGEPRCPTCGDTGVVSR